MPDGTRACGARFTFRGLTIEAKAVESPETPDPDEAIVRRCAWLMHQAMGTRLPLPGHDRESLEKQIVELASAGQAEQADALGRQLALRNEGVAIGPVRTHFEAWSGSMFQGAKER
jgi:hypothetical protein